MTMRLATLADIEAMHRIRLAVHENRLKDPSRVTPADYRVMLETRGRGWVFEQPEIVGFGIADNVARNIWALFVEPGHEGRGIGRALHDAMVEWLFAMGGTPIWLTTDEGTRAARLYRAAGWVPDPTPGPHGEQRFVLERSSTQGRRKAQAGST